MMMRRVLYSSRRLLASLARAEEKSVETEKCLCLEDRCSVHPTCGMPKVVIVGAGCSGISAAIRLMSCGITDVVILEACDRIGGRVMSCWLGDTLVELGLGVIGSANITNPAYNFAITMDGINLRSDEASSPAVFVTSEGRPIDHYTTENLIFHRIVEEVSSIGKGKTSLLHYFDLKFQQELLNYPEHLRYDAERVLYGMANELRTEWGSDLASISASLIKIRKEIPGKKVHISQGNSSFILSMAKNIPFKNLKQKKEVTKINWQAEPANGPRARVCTHDGETYEADYVIITLPIGVLKHRAADIFSPALPDSKMSAMNSVGIGYYNKIYLEYEYPWWAGNLKIRLAWSPSEITRPGNWAVGIGSISSVSRSVLCFLVNGSEALMIEESTEEEIAMELTRLVRKLMKDSTIPFPHHIIVTRWGGNKYCRGSMIGLKIDTTEDDLLELGNPVPEEINDVTPVLMFAGDMTVPQYYGRFPAAIKSGLREADRILDLTRKFSGPPKPKEATPISCST